VFRALLAHPQEVLHKRHLVYCMRIMSVSCATTAVSLQSGHKQFHVHTSHYLLQMLHVSYINYALKYFNKMDPTSKKVNTVLRSDVIEF
jgi:hypothetical protein